MIIVTDMKRIFELAKFSDEDMLRVRFYKNSNFWINNKKKW